MTTEPTQPNWYKSSYSGTQENCVEIARTSHAVLVRDSKQPTGEPVVLSTGGFRALLRTVGETDATG